jgi:hypothetical protein
VPSDLGPQIVVAISTGIGAFLGAGLTLLAGSLTERRRMREIVFMRNLEDRKRIVEEILEANQSLTEFFEDHRHQIDDLQPKDMDEPRERWRVMTRATRRARIYFSADTTGLVSAEAQRWRKLLDLTDLPPGQRQLARFRFTVVQAQSSRKMAEALRREVGEAEWSKSRGASFPSSSRRWFTLRRSVEPSEERSKQQPDP